MIARQTSRQTRDEQQKARASLPPADYMALVRAFALRPIRNAREYDAAAAIVERLAVRPEGSLTDGEQDYLDTLSVLIQAYDDEHFQAEVRTLKSVDLLKYLMEQSGMKAAGLGRLLGNQPLASLILNGHRALSNTHMLILGEHFKVEPGLFLAGTVGRKKSFTLTKGIDAKFTVIKGKGASASFGGTVRRKK